MKKFMKTYTYKELLCKVQVKHDDEWHVIWCNPGGLLRCRADAPALCCLCRHLLWLHADADANGLTKAFQTGADTFKMSLVSRAKNACARGLRCRC
jgi:hypothetical protein